MNDQTIYYFCESKEQAHQAYCQAKNNLQNSVFLSAYPSSSFYFEETNIENVDIEIYESVHAQEEMEDLLKKQIQWAQNVDQYINTTFPDLSSEFNPTVNFLCFIKNTWDTIIHHPEMIEAVIKGTEAERIFFFLNPSPIKITMGMQLEGSIYAHIIPYLCNYHNIPVRTHCSIQVESIPKRDRCMPAEK